MNLTRIVQACDMRNWTEEQYVTSAACMIGLLALGLCVIVIAAVVAA